MNVKTGDRAWIVKSATSSNIGKLVLVGEYVPPKTSIEVDGVSYFSNDAAFVVESLMGPLVTNLNAFVVQRKVHKATWLKPQRDPGEDARDESIAWLPPVPSTTKETA